jgi:hypothetical protein
MNTRRLFRCFDARFLLTVLAAGAAIIAFALLAKQHPRGSTARIALSLCMSASFVFATGVTAASIRRLDELEQRIHLIAIAVAFALTGIVTTTAAFLEKAGGPRLAPDDGWWPLMVLMWVAGVIVLSRRYR